MHRLLVIYPPTTGYILYSTLLYSRVKADQLYIHTYIHTEVYQQFRVPSNDYIITNEYRQQPPPQPQNSTTTLNNYYYYNHEQEMADKLRATQQLEQLQARYVGTGHADTTKLQVFISLFSLSHPIKTKNNNKKNPPHTHNQSN